jgi:hypothetical protein
VYLNKACVAIAFSILSLQTGILIKEKLRLEDGKVTNDKAAISLKNLIAG